jgi:DNA-binding winged helix-turn-helix (wHTH) protein/Tol biopolymer transport system component
MDKQRKPLYEFGRFRLNVEDRLLFLDEEVVPLAPKVFDILLVLVEKSGRVIEKDELIQEVWADTFVEEGNLARNVSTLRKALGESDAERPYIETIPRRGYRFVVPVREVYDQAMLVRERTRITIEQEETNIDETPADDSQQRNSDRTAVAFDRQLEGVTEGSSLKTRTRFKVWWLMAGALIALLVAATFFIGKNTGTTLLPAYQQLTFRRGYIWSARFAPDKQTVIYSAMYDGKPIELYATRPETSESRALGLTDMAVLSISKAGELAVLLKPIITYSTRGTLARMPMTGGAPRELLNNVQDADWSPDGKELAVIHWESGIGRIEYPIGHVLYEAKAPEWISSIRVSPRGDRIAFLDHPSARFDDRGYVAVLDLQGNKKVLSREYTSVWGLVWSSSGDEVFFTASDRDFNNGIRGVTLSGRERGIANATGRMQMLDIADNGKALVIRDDGREGIVALPAGEEKERELSWLDYSWLRDITPDGKTILFDEEGAGGGDKAGVYLRKTDASPAVRLGDGHAIALSPDGKWALAHLRFTKPRRLVLYPTGAGEPRVLIDDATNYAEAGTWFPDSKRVLLQMRVPGEEARNVIQDIDGGEPRPILQPGLTGRWISPDGNYLIATGRGKPRSIYPIDSVDPRPIKGLEDGELILGWDIDGHSIYTGQGVGVPMKLYKLDSLTGKREMIKEVAGLNAAGLFSIDSLRITADGKSYAYGYSNFLSHLFLVDELK